MNYDLRNTLAVDITPEALNAKLSDWAMVGGYKRTASSPGRWEFKRGSLMSAWWNPVALADISLIPATVVITMVADQPARVDCAMAVGGFLALNIGARKKVEREFERLLQAIGGEPVGNIGGSGAARGQATISCPECGAANSPDAKFCGSCGGSMAAAAAAAHCPACNAPITAGAKFCPSCGADLSAQAAPPVCAGCGAQLTASTKFCPSCGRPVNEPA